NICASLNSHIGQNSQMLRYLSVVGVGLMLLAFAQRAQAQTEFKIFVGQQGELSSVAVRVIETSLQDLDQTKSYAITLQGHTDTRGTAREAELRTQAALQSVEAELQKLVSDISSISSENYSDTALEIETADNVGEPHNRYVFVKIEPVAVPSPTSGGFSLYSQAGTSSEYTMDKASEAYAASDFETARKIWEFHANGGPDQADAAYRLALMYVLGEGVDVSQADAFSNYLIAARAGHPKAQLEVSKHYRQGLGVKKDIDQAYFWNFNLLSEFEADRAAQAHMGLILADQGKLKDALWYFEQAGEQGDIPSQRRAGLLHSGAIEGVPENPTKAKYWLGQAALNGDEEAASLLRDYEAETSAALQFPPPKPDPAPAPPPTVAPDRSISVNGFPVFADTALSPLGDAAASCAWVLQSAVDAASESDDIGDTVRLAKQKIYLDLARKIMLNPEHNGGIGKTDVESALARHALLSSFGGEGPSLVECEAAKFLEAK
ncbi:MAG: tetratricopeptide repeat protein, partial [Pseudomonadota bacterium]